MVPLTPMPPTIMELPATATNASGDIGWVFNGSKHISHPGIADTRAGTLAMAVRATTPLTHFLLLLILRSSFIIG
jgi:hypothetical protein